MLRITERAVSYLVEARAALGVPQSYGVRVFGGGSSNGETGVHIKFRQQPAIGDQVTETLGTRVFIAPEIGGRCDDLVLDVNHQADGGPLVLRAEHPDP